ncbi:tubulin alpha chain [Tanacetum coccineum]
MSLGNLLPPWHQFLDQKIRGAHFSLGIVAGERFAIELTPSTFPQRHFAGDIFPQRHVAGERVGMLLGKASNVVHDLDLQKLPIDSLWIEMVLMEQRGLHINEFAVVSPVVVVAPIVVAPITVEPFVVAPIAIAPVAPVAPIVVAPVVPSFVPLGRKIKQNQAEQKLGCEILRCKYDIEGFVVCEITRAYLLTKLEIIAGKGDTYADMDKLCVSFSPLISGMHVPKAVFVDLEPSLIDEVRNERIRILAFRLLVCGLREKRKLGFSSFRSPQVSTSIVEPFRSVLSNHSLLKHITA